MKSRSYKIKGIRPLIMHNEQLSDPLNKWAKAVREISAKRKKTDEDLLEMSRREWMGALYYDAEIGPYIPERCLERMMRDAAAKHKRGKDVIAGMLVTDRVPLEYKGTRDPDTMWDSEDFLLRASVGVSGKRVIRSRPKFEDWAVAFTVEYDETVLQASDLDLFVELSGRLIGLLDWRPKYGRFTVESAK